MVYCIIYLYNRKVIQLKLTLDKAESFVSSTPDCRWDNYTICIFKRDPMAEFNPSGIRVSDQWGYETRIDCDEHGVWTV